MATKYILQKKKLPGKQDEPAKWYATPVSNSPMDEDATTKAATEDTTFSDVELAAAAKLIARFVQKQLLNGQRARIPGLGTFRTTFGSEGVDDINDFDATTMIRNPRISFLCDSKMRSEFLRDLKFENGGVTEDGISYSNLASYRKAKGLTPDEPGGGGEEPGGEGGQGGGEGTLG